MRLRHFCALWVIFREYVSKGQWEKLSPAEVASLPKNTVPSRIRFIPKTNGMRPITRIISTGAAMQVCNANVCVV